ncbi:MAG: hypothetical protein ACK2UW_01985 [Anaerolineales bacterium]|jgi:uncharacterized membrane protein HdeD (DUF308 family)
MKILLSVLGILLCLVGIVFILQGINILPGSPMTGQIQWAVFGTLAIFAGVLLALFANRRTAPPPEE